MSGAGAARRRAVLICYACEPDAGSEEGVGWTWAVAATQVADVVMLTNPVAAVIVQAAADERGIPMRVIGPEPPRLLRPIATRRWGGFMYYLLWQGAAARTLRRLERGGQVDIVHHLTWASDSFPTAVGRSHAPVRIWGPVGGSTRTIRGLYRYLSRRARLDEVVRDVSNACFRLIGGHRVARRATLVAALNDDVADHYSSRARRVIVEPNCALDSEQLGAGERADLPPKTALFVGRLLGWKGPHLAVESLVHAPGWRLVVMGDGPERAAVEARAAALGVADRIDFRGYVPRADVLAAFRSADALLFPSFHDSAPWAVGEASSLGCPVVCIDAGGPPLLAGGNGHVVARHPTADLPRRIGETLVGLDGRGEPEHRWDASRLPGLLADWYGLDPVPARDVAAARTAGVER